MDTGSFIEFQWPPVLESRDLSIFSAIQRAPQRWLRTDAESPTGVPCSLVVVHRSPMVWNSAFFSTTLRKKIEIHNSICAVHFSIFWHATEHHEWYRFRNEYQRLGKTPVTRILQIASSILFFLSRESRSSTVTIPPTGVYRSTPFLVRAFRFNG